MLVSWYKLSVVDFPTGVLVFGALPFQAQGIRVPDVVPLPGG